MNWALVRRDAAMRYVGRWMLVGPAVTLTLMGLVAAVRFSAGPGAGTTPFDVPLIILTLWLPPTLYIWVSALERRCSRFDMELPIASRELWASRAVALVIAGLFVLAATCATLLLASWSVTAWFGLLPAVFGLGDLALALPVVTVALLSVALAQSMTPSLERIPKGPRTSLVIVVAFVAGYLLSWALAVMPLTLSLVPAAVAVWLFRRTREGLPGAVLIAPLTAGWLGRGGRPASRDAGETGVRAVRESGSAGLSPAEWTAAARDRGAAHRLWVLVATIFRSTTKMPVAPILGAPLLLAAGFVMAGAFGEVLRGDDSIRFSLLFIIAYMLLSFSGLPPRRVHMLDAFPMSRRFIFAAMFLPYVLALGLGYGAGRIVADRAENRSEILSLIERDGHFYLSAPLRYGAIAMDGDPPPAIAPWGESHEVWSAPIWEDATPIVYSKYSTPPGSSMEFVAWQIGRAVKDIYGETIGTDEITDRYLTRDQSGDVVPRRDGLTLARDHPGWRVRPYGPVFPVMMLFVCGLWLLALRYYLGKLRPGYTERQKRGAFWLGMVVLLALHLSQFVALFGRLNHWILSGTCMIAIKALAERLPGGSATVWVLCGLFFVLFYRMAEERFHRIESLPGDDMRVALIERPIGAAGAEGAYSR
jgi:hypothetical protein